MGRFQGSAAETFVAEGMIYSWEAICKLWQALGMLDNYGSGEPLLDDADRTVQKNLRDALCLLEAALEKFSCNTVSNVVGHTYNPILHELDPSDPELESLRQRRGSAGGSGMGLSVSLCGAAVAHVVRPGLEVSGILRARPRVWVSLPSALAGRASPAASSAAFGRQSAPPAPSALTAPAAAPEPTTAGAAHVGRTADMCAAETPRAAASAAEVTPFGSPGPALRPSEQLGTEDSEGSATWREWSPASPTGRGHEAGVAATHYRGSRGGSGDSAASGATAPSTVAAAAGHAAGPRGPLQLLLALRAGGGGALRDGSEHSAGAGGEEPGGAAARAAGVKVARVAGWLDQQAARRQEAKGAGASEAIGAASRSGPRLPNAAEPGDDGEGEGYGMYASEGGHSGDDDVCYQQYDTSVHHPVGLCVPPPRPTAAAPLPQAHPPQLQQRVAPMVRSDPPTGGRVGPSSSAAVPVLLALERAATRGAAAARAGAPQQATCLPPTGPTAWLAAAAVHPTGECSGPVAAAGSGVDSARSQGFSGRPDGGINNGGGHTSGVAAGASAARGGSGGGRAMGVGSSAFTGVAAAAALAAAAAFKAATTAAAAEASRAASGRSTPQQTLPSSAAGGAAAGGVASTTTAPLPDATGDVTGRTDGPRTEGPRRQGGSGVHSKRQSRAGSLDGSSGPAAAASAATSGATAASAAQQQPNGRCGNGQVTGGERPNVAAMQQQQQPHKRSGAAPYARGAAAAEAEPTRPNDVATSSSRAKSVPRPPRQPAGPAHAQEQKRQRQPPRKQRPPPDANVSLAQVVGSAGAVEDGHEVQGPADGAPGRGGRTRDRTGADGADASGPPVQLHPDRASKRNAAPAQQPQSQLKQQQQQQFERAGRSYHRYDAQAQGHQPEHYERHPRQAAPEPQVGRGAAPPQLEGAARGGFRHSARSTDGGSGGGDERWEEDEGCEGEEPGAAALEGGRRGGRGGGGGRGRGGGRRGGRGGGGRKRGA